MKEIKEALGGKSRRRLRSGGLSGALTWGGALISQGDSAYSS